MITQLSVKEVRIEVGSKVSEEIEDYVSVENKYREEFEQNALLDLSEIDVYNVEEYQAIVTCEGRELYWTALMMKTVICSLKSR